MYLGRFQVGDEIPLAIATQGSSLNAVAPDACPTVEIYSSTGKVQGWIPSGKGLPIMDPYNATGLFKGRIFLGSMFTPDRYTVLYRWQVSGQGLVSLDTFEVLAGGNDRGHVIALDFYHCPHADFLIQQLDSGRIRAGRNPKL